MRRLTTPLWLMLVVLLACTTNVRANLDEYRFTATTGYWMSDWNQQYIYFDNYDDGVSYPIDMGFPFYFDGTAYTSFTVSTNGLIGLGDIPVSSCWTNQLLNTSGDCNGITDPPYAYTLGTVPHIASYWDDCRADYGAIYSTISGEEPNRVQIIDFLAIESSYFSFVFSYWQVRLYEGSNKIEFYYDYLSPDYYNDGATIGLAKGATNFLSITPQDGGSATVSSAQPNDEFFPSSPYIPSGTLYVFDPCKVVGTGDRSHNESRTLNNGDTLLLNQGTPVFSSVDFAPISLGLSGPNPCTGNSYVSFFIEGDAYSLDMWDGYISGGASLNPVITFSPTTVGKNIGILTVVDESGTKSTYYLAAEGFTRLRFTGNVDQGGTETMAKGDVLMTNIHVRRGQSQGYTPFTLTNKTDGMEGAPAAVTFSIEGISNGQYSISPSQIALGGDESVTPVITFSPTGIGSTPETLIINAEGQIIRFPLNAVSDGVGARFTVPAGTLDNSSQLFINQFSCAGAGGVAIPVDVNNVGNLPFEVSRLDVFLTDTNYSQGQPRYVLLRDGLNQPIPAGDYVLSTTQTTPPSANDIVRLPFTMQPGEKRTLYLTFISQQPGKRFARAFLYSNDELATAIGPDGESVQGLRAFDLFGRGVGARLAGSAQGARVGSVIFPLNTGIGGTSTASRSIFNAGTCDLIISGTDISISGGDVDEFSIISVPQQNAAGNIVIKPGESAEIIFGFAPRQTGSRRATVRLRTNDSTIHVPGVTERGTYYLNLFGGGASGLYLSDIDFGQALIGGDASEHRRDVIRLVNTDAVPQTIGSITITGNDPGEFMKDPLNPWPATSFVLRPGEEIELSVVFAPVAGGVPGTRSAGLTIEVPGHPSYTAQLKGEAGTRSVAISPGIIQFKPMTSGKTQRRMVAITNNGTMTVRMATPVLSSESSSFKLGSLGRMEIEPGGTEYLEVSYAPTEIGPSDATLMIGGNATNMPASVLLSGTAFITKSPDEDGSIPGNVIESGVGRNADLSTSGVELRNEAGGLMLGPCVPNPARETAQFNYSLARAGDVEVALYDATGRLVRVLEQGHRTAGTYDVLADIRLLAPGVYHYRLTMNGAILTRTLHIVR